MSLSFYGWLVVWNIFFPNSWDDDYSEYMGKKMFQTTNQCKMKTLFLGPTANCAFHQVHFPVPSPPNTPQSCKIGPF
jgi:hypothetical protein